MIWDQLKQIVEDVFGTSVPDITPETKLSDLWSDSLLLLEFILTCEDRLDVDLGASADEITENSTMAEIQGYIEAAIERAKQEV